MEKVYVRDTAHSGGTLDAVCCHGVHLGTLVSLLAESIKVNSVQLGCFNPCWHPNVCLIERAGRLQ